MKRTGALYGFVLGLGMLLATGPASAQSEKDCVPAPTNMPNAGYPRVCPDYRVMFKLEAPNARRVQLEPNVGASGINFGEKIYDMVKGADGVWSVTVGPVVPGHHYYHFLVDGLAVADPGSESYTVSLGRQTTWGLMGKDSGIEVLEKGVDYFLPKDVPHGVVEELWYKSKTAGEYRRAFVYTPPGYDKSLTTRFPVLYLQHGGTLDEYAWVNEGHISFIMDNLLAEKKIVPMLVVMDRGYGTWAQTSAQQTLPYSPEIYKASDDKSREMFATNMIKDLIPLIDGRYRTKASRDNRAIAGLSRGAEQAMSIGLGNLDTFSHVAAFSGSGAARDYLAAPTTAFGGIFTKPDVLASKVKVLWIGDGTAESGYKDILQFHQDLEKLGISHVYYEVPGTAHEWATWRKHLYDYAPRLFTAGR